MAWVLSVVAKPHSQAAQAYRKSIGLSPDVIAPGIPQRPQYDLVNHGGKTIRNLTYISFYLGSPGEWAAPDIKSIDSALVSAMTDPSLNDVMAQYFGGQPPTAIANDSQVIGIQPPQRANRSAVEKIVGQLQAGGHLAGWDHGQTVVNLMLPPGTILSDSGGSKRHQALDEEAADSLHGLGGYHGSIHSGGTVTYYAVGVYSQQLPSGNENGIVAFDQPWKNVVATFYHELNEVRTDADVEDAIRAGNDPTAEKLLGWTSTQGYEVGDFPVFEAGRDLALVFQEVPLTKGGTVPIQLMWSNRVHGPEAPARRPLHV